MLLSLLNKRIPFLLLGLLSVTVADVTFADIYKCTSATGKTVYSEKPCPVNNTSAIIEPESQPLNSSFGTTSATPYSIPDVDIYITSWCAYCKKAMAYLDSQGIYYNKYDIEKDSDAASRKKQLKPGYSGIPLTVINDQVISGFSESRFEQALEQ